MRPHRFLPILLAFLCCTAAHGQTAPDATSAPAVIQPPARENLHIYLLMGQSNIAGRDTRTLSSQTTDPRALAMTPDGRWAVAKDPIHQKDGRIAPGAGPGIPFALEMLRTAPDMTIGLVPCAVGGTPLKRWQKGGDLYERAVSRAKLAAQSGVIAGVLWLQGESDADKQPWADSYESRLSRMLKDLRQDLGQPDLPVVVGQIGDFLTKEKHPYVDAVRAAIRKMPADVPNVGYADSTGLGHKGDQLHFNAGAQKQMGARFALAMRQLRNGAAEAAKEPLPVSVFKNLQAGKKQAVVVYGTSLTIKGEWSKALNEYFAKQLTLKS